jgi:hypothetical protein
MSKGLTVNQVLKDTYNEFAKKYSYFLLTFPKQALAVIADDSDWHRTRTGYMSYREIHLVEIENKGWVLGRGEKYGSYPADPYDSDIMLFDFPVTKNVNEKVKDEVFVKVEASNFFSNSVLVGSKEGALLIAKGNDVTSKLNESLKPEISKYVLQEPEILEGLISASTLGPVYKGGFLYDESIIDFLVRSLEDALKYV